MPTHDTNLRCCRCRRSKSKGKLHKEFTLELKREPRRCWQARVFAPSSLFLNKQTKRKTKRRVAGVPGEPQACDTLVRRSRAVIKRLNFSAPIMLRHRHTRKTGTWCGVYWGFRVRSIGHQVTIFTFESLARDEAESGRW